MSRLKHIVQGTRQIQAVEFPLKNVVLPDGAPAVARVGLRVLDGDDYAQILTYATKFAESHGAKAEPGVELYDYGKAAATVAIACVDPDSPLDALVPFFGQSENPTLEERASDVLSSRLIGRDTILFLAECQDVWQDECSPQPGIGEMTPEEYYRMIAEVAAQGPLAFLRLSAASRLKLLLFTANLLTASLTPSTTSGATSTDTPRS